MIGINRIVNKLWALFSLPPNILGEQVVVFHFPSGFLLGQFASVDKGVRSLNMILNTVGLRTRFFMCETEWNRASLQPTCRWRDRNVDVCGHRWRSWVDSDGPVSAGEAAQVEEDSHSAPRLSHSRASMKWGESLNRR